MTMAKKAVAGVGTPEKFFNKYPFLEKRTKRINPKANTSADETVTNRLYKGPSWLLKKLLYIKRAGAKQKDTVSDIESK